MKNFKISFEYGVVAAGLVFLASHAAMGLYGFGILNKPIRDEFGWGRGQVALGMTTLSFVHGICSPFIGRLTDRFGASKVICGTAAVGGIGYTLFTLMQNFWHFYLICGLVGVAMTGVGVIPVASLISRWFVKNRGTMLGVATMGIGLGGYVFVSTFGSWIIPHFGWRTGCFLLALLIFTVIVPLALWLMRAESLRDTKDAEVYGNHKANCTPTGTGEVWSLGMALRTPAFWLIAIAFTLTNFSSVGLMQHLVNIFTDIGITQASSMQVVGLVGIGSTVGKFFFGWLTDRLNAKYCAFISFLLIATPIAMLFVIKSETVMYSCGISLGLGMGGWAPTLSMLNGLTFGLYSYGAIFGMLQLGVCLGVSAGPFVVGYLYDRMHTYDGAFIILLVLCLIGAICILGVRTPRPRAA